MSEKLFVSYRADNEGTTYKNLLVAWSKNNSSHFDIQFDDTSIGTSLNSEDANYIKRRIKEKIKESDYFLLLIGENTHSSEWCNWEIEQAVKMEKKIIAVKIKNSYESPINIYGIGAIWAKSFTYDAIKYAIDSAKLSF